MPFAVGESVGPYRIMAQLGQGGMATVYQAYHAALDRYVALKVLHPAFLEDPNFQARFTREARLVAKLEHPNIVPVYDFAEHEKNPYLVMKYIEGETLKSRLAKGPLTGDEIIRLVDSIGSALTYSHQHGVLHRDIKPSNVLISKDGQIYLSDFGLARIAQSGESTLSSDMIMGTPQYISPEQAMGKKDLDEGTDIYSFGVMLYEMVVGQVPFSADTPFSIIHDHIYTPLPMPRSVNKQVPEGVERVLLKALAKDRSDRFADVISMVKAFKNAWETSGVPIKGTTITLPPQPAPEETPVKEATPAPLPKPEPVSVSSEAETVAVDESDLSERGRGRKSGKKKKRSVWRFLAIGVLIVFCCLVTLVAVNRIKQMNLQFNLDNTPAPPVTEVVEPSPVPVEPSPLPEENPDQVPPEVQAARQFVNENPNDPQAHLELAFAYWQADMPFMAYESIGRAADLAEGNRDPEFLINAGRQLSDRQMWLGAAAMDLRAIKRLQASGQDVPPELFEGFQEAVYRAAEMPDMARVLPFDAIGRVDEPIMLVAQSRNAFYTGDPDAAHGFLNDVQSLKPNFYPAMLWDGELAARENRLEDAQTLLSQLSRDLNAPPWVRDEANSILRTIP
jgi:serine/threonine protein kinase